ncbi:MAG: HU family DNA-binding protein [Rickettsiaceae bacterium]
MHLARHSDKEKKCPWQFLIIFSVNKVTARDGTNPRTGAAIKIAAYNQPKLKVGQKLKDTCS